MCLTKLEDDEMLNYLSQVKSSQGTDSRSIRGSIQLEMKHIRRQSCDLEELTHVQVVAHDDGHKLTISAAKTFGSATIRI